MHSARKAQRAQSRKRPSSECFFTTPPHPSQKYYSAKGKGSTKENKTIANRVNLDKINQYHIGVDSSFTVIKTNCFILQHGKLKDNKFSIRTSVFGKNACSTFDSNMTTERSKRERDVAHGDTPPAARQKLSFNVDPGGKSVHQTKDQITTNFPCLLTIYFFVN
jgi:hypothetical protein